jgi:hypothetical protein
MIKIENVDVYGWDAAIRGARNPMNSWDKSDSGYAVDCERCGKIEREGVCKSEDRDCTGFECYYVGHNDYRLLRNLANAGPDHGKYLRFITVSVDITAPLYWYKEFDTYKVGTVANSCSTMHKIHANPFSLEDFSHEQMTCDAVSILNLVIDHLNQRRSDFLESGRKIYWWDLIQLLPTSYNQRRTVLLNYAVLRNMYHARRNHKLDEWRTFCEFIETLPYSELITGGETDARP